MSLRADRLNFAFSPGRPVLRDLAADFPPASVTVIVGPNGSGKTTLLRLLLGFLTPVSGMVTLGGAAVRSLSPAHRAARMAYVPQHADLAAPLTVRQTVALSHYARQPSPDTVERSLAAVDLLDRADDPFHILSAGQQQRASLARALAQLDGAPADSAEQALLADEPCAALDPRHAIRAVELLRRQAAAGRAVIVVMHDLSAAAACADRALVLTDHGASAAHGPAADALVPSVLGPVFGVPFASIPRPDRPDLPPLIVPDPPRASTMRPI